MNDLTSTDNERIKATTIKLVDGLLKVPDNNFSSYNIISALKYLKPTFPNKEAQQKYIDDYERGMKIMIVEKIVKEAYRKFNPILACRHDDWEKLWEEFILTQLYL